MIVGDQISPCFANVSVSVLTKCIFGPYYAKVLVMNAILAFWTITPIAIKGFVYRDRSYNNLFQKGTKIIHKGNIFELCFMPSFLFGSPVREHLYCRCTIPLAFTGKA